MIQSLPGALLERGAFLGLQCTIGERNCYFCIQVVYAKIRLTSKPGQKLQSKGTCMYKSLEPSRGTFKP